MIVTLDKIDAAHSFGRVRFERADEMWLRMTPWSRALAHVVLAFEMKLRKLGLVPDHMNGITSRNGTIFLECCHFKLDDSGTASFLGWSKAGKPAWIERCATS